MASRVYQDTCVKRMMAAYYCWFTLVYSMTAKTVWLKNEVLYGNFQIWEFEGDYALSFFKNICVKAKTQV